MTAAQLRNSILQEAISGRLTQSDTSDWREITIGQLGTVVTGTTPSKQNKEYYGDDYPFYKPSDLDAGIYTVKASDGLSKVGYEHARQLPANSILVTCIGATIGKTGLIKREGSCNQQINAIIPDADCDSRFIYYLMISPDVQEVIKYKSYSTTLPILNKTQFSQLEVTLPPLAEQKRIVAKLEELLPIVEQYGKAQKELDELNAALPARLRQSILQEAISGRLVPQDENETADGLKEHLLQAVNNSPFKKKWYSELIEDEELPFDIPDNWRWIRLGDIVYTQTGLSYSKGDLEKKVSNPIRVLRGGNIQSGSWCTKDDDVMIAPEFVKKDIFLKKNSFITPAVTSLEHLGKTALIREDHNDIVAGGFVLYLMPYDDKNDVLMEYLAYFFQSAFYNSFCKTITNKSGQAFWNISREKLLKLTIPLPPLAEQQRIVAKIEELFAEIDKLK